MRVMAIALLSALLLCGIASGSPPNPSRHPPSSEKAGQANTAKEGAKPDERGTTAEPLVVNPLVVKTYAQKSDKDAADEEEQKRDKAKTDRWTIGIGLATIVILLVQAVFFALQARRLRQTIDAMQTIAKEQRKDINSQIEIAKDAAEIAKRTADTNEEELISAHRPWLIVSGLTQEGTFRTRHDRLRFKFKLKNVGGTPAVNIFFNSEIMPVRDPVEADFTAALERLRPTRMAPGVTLVTTDSITMPDSVGAENITSTPNRQDMAFLLVCVYYSFTFKLTDRTGYYIAGYRIFEDKIADDGEISVRLDRYHAHAI